MHIIDAMLEIAIADELHTVFHARRRLTPAWIIPRGSSELSRTQKRFRAFRTVACTPSFSAADAIRPNFLASFFSGPRHA